MQLTRQNAEVLFTGWNAIFQNAYGATPQFWKGFATEVPSGTTSELYHWIAQLPGLREWVGPRIKNNVALRDYTVTNKDFEGTIGLNKFRVRDDTHGAFAGTVAAFAQSVARWQDEQTSAAVEAGTTALCYDGQYFFDTDHPISLDEAGFGTFSNKLVGAAYSLAADPLGTWQAASELMATYKGDSGKPLGLIADTLMVPPTLRRYAVQAAKAELVPQTIKNVAGAENVAAAGVSNVYMGDFTVIVNPYLTSAASIVMCTKRGVNPFIFQMNTAPTFVTLTDPTLPNAFNEKEFVYGCEARGAAAYSLPQLAVRCSAA